LRGILRARHGSVWHYRLAAVADEGFLHRNWRLVASPDALAIGLIRHATGSTSVGRYVIAARLLVGGTMTRAVAQRSAERSVT
jgi:hypothetical protein